MIEEPNTEVEEDDDEELLEDEDQLNEVPAGRKRSLMPIEML